MSMSHSRYKEWDARRKLLWPDANHYHWISMFHNKVIAEWHPSTCVCYVEGFK